MKVIFGVQSFGCSAKENLHFGYKTTEIQENWKENWKNIINTTELLKANINYQFVRQMNKLMTGADGANKELVEWCLERLPEGFDKTTLSEMWKVYNR